MRSLWFWLEHIRFSCRFVSSSFYHVRTEDERYDYDDKYQSGQGSEDGEDTPCIGQMSLLFRIDLDNAGFLLYLDDQLSDYIGLVRIDFTQRYFKRLFLCL